MTLTENASVCFRILAYNVKCGLTNLIWQIEILWDLNVFKIHFSRSHVIYAK